MSIPKLCGRFTVLPNEDQAEYHGLFWRFMEAEQPADEVERELVAKMVRHTWLSNRALRLQEACFLFQPQTPEQQASGKHSVGVMKDIAVYERYQAHHDRSYQRASNELARRRKDRAQAARGFESQKRAAAEEERREKRQNQRDELHHYKVATAKLRSERKGHGFRAAKQDTDSQMLRAARSGRGRLARIAQKQQLERYSRPTMPDPVGQNHRSAPQSPKLLSAEAIMANP